MYFNHITNYEHYKKILQHKNSNKYKFFTKIKYFKNIASQKLICYSPRQNNVNWMKVFNKTTEKLRNLFQLTRS